MKNEDREFDQDYARLSLLAGFFAGTADHALGRNYFVQRVRRDRFDLTWAKLAAWKAEAVSMGVPEIVIKDPPEGEVEQLVAHGLILQAEHDATRSTKH